MDWEKVIKLLGQFVSKNHTKEVMTFVNENGKIAVASDSFRLVEVENVDAKGAKKLDTDFPKYDNLFNQGNFIEVILDGKYLSDIALALSKFSTTEYTANNGKKKVQENHAVILKVPVDKLNPIEIHANGKGYKVRALLMPMNK